jgi:hypothetical protein
MWGGSLDERERSERLKTTDITPNPDNPRKIGLVAGVLVGVFVAVLSWL